MIKNNLLVGVFLIIFSLESLLVLTSLNFYPFFGNKLLLLELLKTNFDLPIGVIFFAGFFNIVLLFLLTKKITSQTKAYFASGLYAISAWSIYSGLFNSLYTLGVFFLLIFCLGVVYLKKNRLGFGLMLPGMIGLTSCSFLFWPSLLLFFGVDYKFHFLKEKHRLLGIILLVLMMTFIFSIGLTDTANLKQVFHHEVTIFDDVGLINSVNRFQGKATNAHLGTLGRLTNNKYSYLSLQVLFNISGHFVPLTYFTPNYKIFGFSSESPLLIGLLVASIWGFSYIVKQKKKWFLFFGFLLLIVPSVLTDNSPDLNRLFMVAPLFFLVCGIGLEQLSKKNRRLFILLSVLILFQWLVMLSDIYLREPARLKTIVNRVYEIRN